MKTKYSIGAHLLTALALAACAKSTEPVKVGGETNWLLACSDSNECDQGSCLCGVCTIECEGGEACSGRFAGTCKGTERGIGEHTCARESDRAPAALCLPDCDDDTDCGSDFACRDGVCVTEPTAMRADAEDRNAGDASVPGDAGHDASILGDAGTCRQATRPPCSDAGAPCTWMDAQALLPTCWTPGLSPYYAVRCGTHDALAMQGTDSASYFYYDGAGALVGRNDVGLVSDPGCTSYDPAVTSLAASCTAITPQCVPDAGAPVCDCGSDELSLECVCTNITCRSFADATSNVTCQAGSPSTSTMARGCGFVRVTLRAGLSSTTFVYEQSDDTLVGALQVDDVAFGECETNRYATALPDLTECADYSICDLCNSGAYPACDL